MRMKPTEEQRRLMLENSELRVQVDDWSRLATRYAKERDDWKARADRMQPVVEAAIEWRNVDYGEPGETIAEAGLLDAVRDYENSSNHKERK